MSKSQRFFPEKSAQTVRLIIQKKYYNSGTFGEFFKDLEVYKSEHRLVGYKIDFTLNVLSARIEYLPKFH